MAAYVLLAFEPHLSTALLVLGAVSLAVAIAFASRSTRDENHRTEKDLGHRRVRGIDPRRHKAPPPPIHRTIVLLPEGKTLAKKAAPAKQATKPAAAKPSAEELMTPEQAALAADLAWLNEMYERNEALDNIDARRAQQIIEQLADAEPTRMIALLRKWLSDENR